MTSLPRSCVGCGRKIAAGSRCSSCTPQRSPRPTTVSRDWTERKRRADAVAAHRANYGEWCPGYQRPAHAVLWPNLLTADHVYPVGQGGDPRGPLTVLCRAYNSKKGAASREKGRLATRIPAREAITHPPGVPGFA